MKFFCLVAFIVVGGYWVNGQAEDFSFISWQKADSTAMLFPNHNLKNLNVLAFKLTNDLNSDVEKFRSIYRWVCENISYDHPLYLKNQKKRERITDEEELKTWYEEGSSLMFESLLKRRKTICTGYAYLIRELARCAGIKCEIVDGYGRSATVNVGGNGFPNHQWNAVQLNGKWYLCDATWSAGSVSVPSGVYKKDFRDVYFLCDPKLFIRNHYPIENKWTLLESAPTLDSFLNSPIFYYKALALAIDSVSPKEFEVSAVKKEPFQFSFNSNQDSIKNVTVSINNVVSDFYLSVPGGSNGLHEMEHTFRSRGTYVISVSQDNQSLFSYKVKVK